MLSIKVGILCAKQKFAKAAMQLLGHVEVVQGLVRGGDCLLLHHRVSFRQTYPKLVISGWVLRVQNGSGQALGFQNWVDHKMSPILDSSYKSNK